MQGFSLLQCFRTSDELCEESVGLKRRAVWTLLRAVWPEVELVDLDVGAAARARVVHGRTRRECVVVDARQKRVGSTPRKESVELCFMVTHGILRV